MTEQKQSCGECHWWRNPREEYHAHGLLCADCVVPRPDSVMSVGTMRQDEGAHCPAFRQRGERLPQRFRWKESGINAWRYGVCTPGTTCWFVRASAAGHGSFDNDPWESLGHIIGDVESFEWIDNDFGWSGK